MELATSENILNLLFAYNPWWSTNIIQKEFTKDVKRCAYFEAYQTMMNSEIRRFAILCGVRRTGKTTIMYQTIDKLLKSGVPSKNILFVSFDHPLLKLFSFDKVLEIYRTNISCDEEIYCFFDEIQYAENWNIWLKILYDTTPKIKVMATGSASPILQNKSTESGLGRWKIINIPTLSFYEYCMLKKIEINSLPQNISPLQIYQLSKQEQTDIFSKLSNLQIHFLRYLQIGGFPELALSSEGIYAQRILREEIVDKALKKDLPSIYGIRSIRDMEKIFLYLCYCSSNIINISNMTKELNGINRKTVEDYIQYLSGANLIYISPAVSLGVKQLLKTQDKIYIADPAIRNAVLVLGDITNNPDELGLIAETAVYKHIKTYFDNQNTLVGYFRGGAKGKEIDIVVKKDSNINNLLIEVKYREQSKINEDDAIIEQGNKISPGFVVTKRPNDFGLFEYNNTSIYKIPAPAFLYLLGAEEYQQTQNKI